MGENTAHAFTARANQGRCKHDCIGMSHSHWNASYRIPHQHLSIPESVCLCTVIQFQHLSSSPISLFLFIKLQDSTECVCVCVLNFCKNTRRTSFYTVEHCKTSLFTKATALFSTSLKHAVFLNVISAPSSMPVIISKHRT